MKMNEKQDPYLDNCAHIKTILMILVVFYHCIVFWTGHWVDSPIPAFESDVLAYLSRWLNSILIEGFTLISGYLFFYLNEEQKHYKSMKVFVQKKFNRLIIPYIFISLVWAIPASILLFKYDYYQILDSFILAKSPDQLWFLLMLFDVFIIFKLLSPLFKKHTYLGAVIVCGSYMLGLAGTQFIPNYFCVLNALRFLPYFWIGYIIRQKGTALIMRVSPMWVVGAHTIVFIICCNIPEIESIHIVLVHASLEFMLSILGGIMSFVVLQYLLAHSSPCKTIRFLVPYTMPIYLFHQQIVYIGIFCFNGVLPPILNASVNFIMAFGISLLIALILKRYKFTNILIGN